MPDRPYQTRIIDQVRNSVRRGHKRILIVLPTGAGKGYVAARLIQESAKKGNSSVFFADQRELIHQIASHLTTLRVPARTIMAGVTDEYGSHEMYRDSVLAHLVAKDTLFARAFRRDTLEPPNATFIQNDEAHKSLAPTWQTVLEYYDGCIQLGWTATPIRTDGRGMGDMYTDMVVGATYADLQRDGYLVPVRVFAPHRPDLGGLKVARGDYSKASLEQRMNRDEMVGDIIREWREHSEGRQTVVFASGVQHSIHVRNEFRAAGISAEHVDGKMPDSEREDIIGSVRNGDTTVLCNYGIATTGVDIPGWKYMVCARPTKSFLLHRQMGGRIQRPLAGHAECVIQDHSDNCLVYGYPDEDVEWTLDTTEKVFEKHQAKQREKGQKDPYHCEKCQTVYRGPHCPTCGHRPERREQSPAMAKEERLKELERKRRAMTVMDKQKLWDECLGWAVGTRRKVGAAAHRYKNTVGAFPTHQIQNVPRGSQWKMNALDYYRDVVKPSKQAAEMEYAMAENW